MPLFLLVFVSVYGAMNAYCFWRIHAAFPGMGRWRVLLGAFLLLMLAAPFLVRSLDRARHFGLARGLGLIAYLWLAGLLWFCVMGWLVDGWNVLVRLVALAAPPARAALAPPRPTLAVMVVAILAAGGWAWRQAGRIRVEEITVEVPHLPAGADSLRIAEIADLHLGGPRSEQRLAETVEILRRLRPDVIVSTGDLVDAELHNIAHLAEPLRGLEAPLGKFAVLGNHEFYAGVNDSLAFHEAAGFRVLRGESVSPAAGLRIAGVDDPGRGRPGPKRHTDELAALPAGPRTAATVLLKHQPRVAAAERFDLQLSGHTHGGQIFPFNFVTALFYPLGSGRHDLPGGATVYVSRGTGTWGPPLRLGSPPEVTLVTLKRCVVQTAPAAGNTATRQAGGAGRSRTQPAPNGP